MTMRAIRSSWGTLSKRAAVMGVALSVAVVAGGCGDEPLGTADTNNGFDIPIADGIADIALPDIPDAADAPNDAVADFEDSSSDPGTDSADTAQPDVSDIAETIADVTPDVADIETTTPDKESPTVVSTTPAADEEGVATPFTVSVVFSEKMATQNIVAQTFWIENSKGNKMSGTIEIGADLASVTWTAEFPEGLVPLASYRVVIDGNIVSDPAGNKLEGGGVWSVRFYTGDFPDTDAYAALARQYAPTIRSASGTDSAAQVPTRVNADGDYNGVNTAQWLASADSVTPAVYWTVNETRSHYFIHYMYFFPLLNDPAVNAGHGNGAAGAMVVVEKAHGAVTQRPIAVTTYFKSKQYEENRTFATQESGIKGPSSASFYDLKGVFPQATLFPDERFESYVTAGGHESCLWIQEQTSTFCNLESFSKPSLKLLEFAPTADGEPATPVTKVAGVFPTDMDDVDGVDAYLYDLVSADTSLWPRRILTSTTDGLFAGNDDIVADVGRPADGLVMPFKFVDPFDPFSSAFGRPIWAWLFNPASGSISAGINAGEFGMDPAWYFWKRHKSDSQTTALEPFDEGTLEGFSLDYCFNPKALLDNRSTDTFCQ